VDLSIGGAQITPGLDARPGDRAVLNLPGVGPISARVVAATAQALHLHFTLRGPQEEALATLLQAA
jgi:hypothetical protein